MDAAPKKQAEPVEPSRLDLTNLIRERREELARLDDVIGAFECITAGQPKRRGRPPKWLAEAKRTERSE